ncbi:MAG: hypothetical protein JRI87_10895 [Deltaproteobacteria bacterium]|nr:hypothetical protein [Deltaproteobacteria bacterium]
MISRRNIENCLDQGLSAVVATYYSLGAEMNQGAFLGYLCLTNIIFHSGSVTGLMCSKWLYLLVFYKYAFGGFFTLTLTNMNPPSKGLKNSG